MALHIVYDKIDNITDIKGRVTYYRPKYAK